MVAAASHTILESMSHPLQPASPGPAILIVDDEADFRENTALYLSEQGYRVLQAGDCEAALALARDTPLDAALVDVMMPGRSGLELLACLKQLDERLEVIVITGRSSIESAVEAMRHGAFHYVTKPVRLAELELLLGRCVEKGRLARQNKLYEVQLQRRGRNGRPEVVACSESLRTVAALIEQLGATDSPVLFEGETGTGKDLLARALHAASARAKGPFVVMDCGALYGPLLDDELFGHEKGAFSGADEARPGLLEMAGGGTLLLDEVGDMPPGAQVRMLRFLERRVVRRLGSTRERRVDARVLSATHRDLSLEVARGRFREDLYHRLVVVRVCIPPLRERPEDIVPLAHHFARRLSSAAEPALPFSPRADDSLLGHGWPGNVRELAHTVERGVISARVEGSPAVEPHHLGLPEGAQGGRLVPLDEARRRHVKAVLEQVGGNRREAARILGVSERHLYRLLKQS